jgi:AmmeMemoRadiSam system protein B/AmmeMemoRadiSam system protein A
LSQAVRGYLEGGEQAPGRGAVGALIVPHAGYAYSGRIAGRAYACVDGTCIERVVVLAPSHAGTFRGLGVGQFRAFRTPLGDLPVDAAVCRELAGGGSGWANCAAAFQGEHALEVQLPFLQTVCPAARLVPLLCGEIQAEEVAALAARLAAVVPHEGTLWVVSSDFTHYGEDFGYVPFTQDVLARVEQLDRGAIATILPGDAAALREYLRATGATVCGADAIAILLGVLPQLGSAWEPHLLEYAQSGRLTHDETHSVGYAALAFCRAVASGEGPAWQPSAAAGEVLLRLARETLEAELSGRTPPSPEPAALPAELTRVGAAFVSLHTAGVLRGCMGTLEPRQALYLDAMENARNAGFRDPRFQPLQTAELAQLELEISVLGPLRRIAEPAQFEVGRHGLLLRRGRSSAVYLPQVATEQGWDRQTTLEHLCRKAGLPPGAWRQGAEFHVFEACVFGGGEG